MLSDPFSWPYAYGRVFKYPCWSGKVHDRGVSSNGRAPASHAGGRGIDAPTLQVNFLSHGTALCIKGTRRFSFMHGDLRSWLLWVATSRPDVMFDSFGLWCTGDCFESLKQPPLSSSSSVAQWKRAGPITQRS